MSKKPYRKQLNILQSSQLLLLVQAEYAEKKLNDVEFAKYASQKLGYEVNENQVEGRRHALGIPSTRTVIVQKKAVTVDALVDMLAALEVRIQALENDKA